MAGRLEQRRSGTPPATRRQYLSLLLVVVVVVFISRCIYIYIYNYICICICVRCQRLIRRARHRQAVSSLSGQSNNSYSIDSSNNNDSIKSSNDSYYIDSSNNNDSINSIIEINNSN